MGPFVSGFYFKEPLHQSFPATVREGDAYQVCVQSAINHMDEADAGLTLYRRGGT